MLWVLINVIHLTIQLQRITLTLKPTKMKNAITTKFENKVTEIVVQQKESIDRQFAEAMAKINDFKFETFTNENPYIGEISNKIFFTYSDHYRANSGVYMTVESLHNAHVNMDDRGYINGVATDLHGYMILRSMNIVHNFDAVVRIYFPKFRKSKHKETYLQLCESKSVAGMKDVQNYIDEKIKLVNVKLADLTGCSLLHYLRQI